MDEEILKTLKSIERLLQTLNRNLLGVNGLGNIHVGDVPPYQEYPYPKPIISWRTTDNTNG